MVQRPHVKSAPLSVTAALCQVPHAALFTLAAPDLKGRGYAVDFRPSSKQRSPTLKINSWLQTGYDDDVADRGSDDDDSSGYGNLLNSVARRT